ncbi:putative glutamate receptor [Nymphon striatum]|nr:putative glutamate receptor [Nymphon striatum]
MTKVDETKHLFKVMGVYRDYTIGIVSLRYVANEVPYTSLSKDDNGWKFGGLVGEPVSVVINHLGLKFGNLYPQTDGIYGDYIEETNVTTGMFKKLLTKVNRHYTAERGWLTRAAQAFENEIKDGSSGDATYNFIIETFEKRFVKYEEAQAAIECLTVDENQLESEITQSSEYLDTFMMEADMIIASLSLTSRRRKIVDFSYPIFEQCISAIYKDRTQNDSWKFFMKPLSKNSWILTVTATCLFIISAITFVKIFTQEYINESTLWGMVMLQGIDVQSNSTGMLLLCFSFMLLGTLLSMFYSSTIISQNAVASENAPFNTLGELAESSEYKPIIRKGTSILQMISNSKDVEYAAIWKKMKIDIDGHTVANLNESLQRLNTGQEAYIGGKMGLLHMQSLDHSLKQIDAEYDCSGLYIAFQKNSPLTGIFRKSAICFQWGTLLNDECTDGAILYADSQCCAIHRMRDECPSYTEYVKLVKNVMENDSK